MQDVTEHGQFDTWYIGRQWQRERLKIGKEYISWPQHREMKEMRGRRCVFLGFVSLPYGTGAEARVSFTDDDQVEIVAPEDLIAAWLVGAPRRCDNSEGRARLTEYTQ
jgi:hypothetical protein